MSLTPPRPVSRLFDRSATAESLDVRSFLRKALKNNHIPATSDKRFEKAELRAMLLSIGQAGQSDNEAARGCERGRHESQADAIGPGPATVACDGRTLADRFLRLARNQLINPDTAPLSEAKEAKGNQRTLKGDERLFSFIPSVSH